MLYNTKPDNVLILQEIRKERDERGRRERMRKAKEQKRQRRKKKRKSQRRCSPMWVADKSAVILVHYMVLSVSQSLTPPRHNKPLP
jgi:hypothetical protein